AAMPALLSREIGTAFDLERGPLSRVLWVREAEDAHVVMLHQHHIVTDEWSMGLLLREWSLLYEGTRRGEEASLRALGYRYADYAQAEQQALSGGGLSASRAYWKEQLSGLPRLELPLLRAAPGSGRGPERYVSFLLPAEVSSALRALSRASGCTLFMAYYA